MPHPFDEQLIEDYLNGDEESFEILIRRWLGPVYGFVYKYVGGVQDAEDITQEIFAKVWKNLRNFNRQKNFKPWLFSIAKNAALDFLKKKKTAPFSEFENETGENPLVESLADDSPLPSELSERAELSAKIKAVFRKLSPKYGAALSLYYYGDMNFREIAQSLGEPLNTVKSRHRRAIAALEDILAEFRI